MNCGHESHIPHCCRLCQEEHLKDIEFGWAKRTFVVCSDCGNKRCPKASAHWQVCTQSNDDGQRGSFYGPKEHWPVPQTSEEPKKG